jgi:hypothetical protein
MRPGLFAGGVFVASLEVTFLAPRLAMVCSWSLPLMIQGNPMSFASLDLVRKLRTGKAISGSRMVSLLLDSGAGRIRDRFEQQRLGIEGG